MRSKDTEAQKQRPCVCGDDEEVDRHGLEVGAPVLAPDHLGREQPPQKRQRPLPCNPRACEKEVLSCPSPSPSPSAASTPQPNTSHTHADTRIACGTAGREARTGGEEGGGEGDAVVGVELGGGGQQPQPQRQRVVVPHPLRLTAPHTHFRVTAPPPCLSTSRPPHHTRV
eukprot:2809425-Rhodomonas_salina.1